MDGKTQLGRYAMQQHFYDVHNFKLCHAISYDIHMLLFPFLHAVLYDSK